MTLLKAGSDEERFFDAATKLRKIIEAHCIHQNANEMVKLFYLDREKFDSLIEKLPSSEKAASKGDYLALMSALQLVYFNEHLELFFTLSGKLNDSKQRSEFERCKQYLAKYRNAGDAHVRVVLDEAPNFSELEDAGLTMLKILGVEEKTILEWVEKYLSTSEKQIHHNLPVPDWEVEGVRFVGRKDLLNIHLPTALKRHSVVTISGRGGLGKSAVAQQFVWSGQAKNLGFTKVVWFSSKTDRMTARGIEVEGDIRGTFQEFVNAIFQVLAYEESGDWSTDEKMEYLSMLNDAGRNESVLVIVDNFETLEEVAGVEDYRTFVSCIAGEIQDEKYAFIQNFKWLVTSRHGEDFGSTIKLDRLDAESADKLLTDTLKNRLIQEQRIRRHFQPKKNRDAFLKKAHYYPLYIKMFLGWLEAEVYSLQDLFSKEFAGLRELENFCFRKTLEVIEGDSQVCEIVAALMAAEKSGITDLSETELAEVVSIGKDDLGAGLAKLSKLCVVHSRTNLSLAPAISNYLNINFNNKKRIRQNFKLTQAVDVIRKRRKVRPEYLGLNWDGRLAQDLAQAVQCWSSNKGQHDSVEVMRMEIESLKGNAFQRQLHILNNLISESPPTASEALMKVKSEVEKGASYWHFIERILGRLISGQLDPEGKVAHRFLRDIAPVFESVTEFKYSMLKSEVYCSRHDLIMYVRALKKTNELATKDSNKRRAYDGIKYALNQAANVNRSFLANPECTEVISALLKLARLKSRIQTKGELVRCYEDAMRWKRHLGNFDAWRDLAGEISYLAQELNDFDLAANLRE